MSDFRKDLKQHVLSELTSFTQNLHQKERVLTLTISISPKAWKLHVDNSKDRENYELHGTVNDPSPLTSNQMGNAMEAAKGGLLNLFKGSPTIPHPLGNPPSAQIIREELLAEVRKINQTLDQMLDIYRKT